MIRRIVTILIVIAIAFCGADAAKPKKKKQPAKPATETSQSVRQQQQATARKIKETDEQIKANNRQVSNKLNELNLISGQMAQCSDSIATLNTSIRTIENEYDAITDSISQLNIHLTSLQEAFAEALRSARLTRGSTTKLALIFSSESFTQAFRRLRAIEQFGNWRDRRQAEITQVKAQLSYRQLQLDTLRTRLTEAHSLLARRQMTLQSRSNAANRLVADLRGKDKQLRRVLVEQQKKARDLDAKLNRIIAEEMRRAEEEARRRQAEEAARRRAEEEARLRAEAERQAQEQAAAATAEKPASKSSKKSGNKQQAQPQQPSTDMAINNVPAPSIPAIKPASTFAASRGLLPSPVDGSYTVVKPFGRQRHPTYPNLEIDNAGIDIQTSQGATVRSVFDGEVSAVFCPDQLSHVIVVRHGDYVTVYAGIGQLSCRKGDKVKRGQALGKVYVDAADSNRSILHFEIRNGANPSNIKKENPLTWLRR